MDDKAWLIHVLQRLAEFPLAKIVAGVGLWLLKLLFGPVFRPVYGTVILLWLADFGTGFYHARANPAVRPDSRRLYHGLVKLGIYLFLLILGNFCSQTELTAVIRTVIESFIILTESYSILENLQKICVLKNWPAPLLDQIMKTIQGRLNDSGGDAANDGPWRG
ncbi:phage-related holin [Hydrogenispora ethanolica]|uniref:Phage-related holin n=1 Tax=Hydrogenispora ethanolica TaxID=1082276 RepID=A0A4R1SB90_HYDET|nr:phage holin family protein [Hydrogenispora ethanolica]TCL76815.1 phage-related holin [Hydrogenispora ethanolica]